MSIIGLIPARGGSKGIPNKNIAICAGRPLLAYTAESALGASNLDRVILSTDSNEIAESGKALGLEVPFIRPAQLAGDKSTMIEVLRHALQWFRDEGTEPEAILLLQPTSPLRTQRHIEEAIDLFREKKAQTLVSLVQVPHQFHPLSVMNLSQEGELSSYIPTDEPILRRQDKPSVYGRNGPAILIVRPEVIVDGRLYGDRTIGYLMDEDSSLDVDGPADLERAQMLIQRRTKPE